MENPFTQKKTTADVGLLQHCHLPDEINAAAKRLHVHDVVLPKSIAKGGRLKKKLKEEIKNANPVNVIFKTVNG